MSDYISREAATADSDRNKIKTPFARIVVEGTPGKPYYNIWYFDPVDGECHIRFGSYCLGNVFNWLAEEFEITEPNTDVAPVAHGRWECVYDDSTGETDITCSHCKNTRTVNGCFVSTDGKSCYFEDYYCPNCGSKMDLEDETNDN